MAIEAEAESEVKKILETVSDNNGVRVASKFGFKTETLDGKKYLVPMTEAEAQEIAEKELIGESFQLGTCYRDYTNCLRTNCSGFCKLVSSRGSFFCVCAH